MILPEVLEKQLDEFIEEYKRERGTTFVSRFEKRAIRRGLEQRLQQGLQQGVAVFRETLMRILRRRFGDEAERVRGAVEALNSLETLERLMDAAVESPDLQAFEALLQTYSSPAQ
ncbi:MAG: hypothetical protein WHS44_02675 [Fimbriimonadales bacterium]|nr:MAG: hypothetical protein KatS3mg018_2001 [Fimbriimonadales bacterium]